MLKNIIIIPIYNDWRSLNKLLFQLDNIFKSYEKIKHEILILNDNSTEKVNIDKHNLSSIHKISIIKLNKNLGSQKAIAVGLNYLKKKAKECFITIMDGDGEDDPLQIKNMLEEAEQNQDFIITSNRKKREESLLIQVLYKIHLLITFIFTLKWISFGNFTTFNSKNISKILSNSNSWYAHSSSVLNNCKIKRLYAKRTKRYYDKSKVNLLSLMEHALRVNVVFLPKILLISLLYLFILFFTLEVFYLNYILAFFILSFNILLLFIKKKHYIKNLSNLNDYIDNVKLL